MVKTDLGKVKKARRLDKDGESSLATILADELAAASRAVGWATAVAWGTRILWGGVFLGALARLLGANASATGTIALISLISAFVVGGAVGRKKSGASATETRRRALLAARRLERRFPEQAGVWVAGVDFCCESATEGESARTSDDLRGATITLAARRLANAASETDEANWRAILTGEKSERFRNRRKKAVVCAFAALINLAFWGNGAVWEFGGEGKRGAFLASGEKTSENDGRVDENKVNNKNKEKKKDKKDKENEGIAAVGKNEGNKETRDGERGAASSVGEPSLDGDLITALDVLISEFAQNAEIAEVLKTELENAAVTERTNAEKSKISSGDSTRFLFLAREFNANLTRPKTGILAQVRRLKATLQRERRTIFERWNKIEEMGEITRIAKKREVEEIDGIGEENEAINGAGGTEIALLLLLSRLNKFEAKMGGAEIEAAETLGLSAILRSDSAAERAKTLDAASRRIGEWATALRREATAAQILRESWRFDATSQSWKAASEAAWQKNQTLLARFAGRSTQRVAGGAGEDAAFEKAKERFVDAWRNARSIETERFEVVERLRKRLQAEDAEEFVESLGAENGLRDVDLLGNDDWDAAAWNAINDAASMAKKRESSAMEAFENNRFGIVAEALRTREERLAIEAPTVGRTVNESGGDDGERETAAANVVLGEVNADKKEVKGNNMDNAGRGEEEASARRKERRLTFLATRLTFGVDGETLRRGMTRHVEKKEVELNENAFVAGASSRRENEVRRANEEAKIAALNDGKNDATSLENAAGLKTEKALALETVNIEEINGYQEGGNAEKTQAPRKEKDLALRGDENGSRGGVEPNVGAATGGGGNGGVLNDGTETQVDENKAFSGELPPEVRRRFEGTSAPEITPKYAEKIQLYRRRISNERR